jgi:hypothetical protein
MRRRSIEKLDTWPSLRVTVQLLPWHWALWFWRDDVETRCWHLDIGPLSVECIANRPLFAIEPSRDTTGGDE